MKASYFCTLILFLVSINSAFSQDKLNIGLRIGYNSSNFVGKDIPGKSSRSLPGIYLGGTVNYPLRNNLSVSTGIAVDTKGAKINTISDINEVMYFLYLDIPVMLRYSPFSGKPFPVYLSAGHSVDFLIVKGTFLSVLDDVKNLDMAFLIEGGLAWKKIGFGIRYAHSYLNFDKSENNFKMRNATLSIMATFNFK